MNVTLSIEILNKILAHQVQKTVKIYLTNKYIYPLKNAEK